MKKVFSLLFIFLTAIILLAQQFVIVKTVEASLPDSLYKSTGTKTFNVQYLKLFSEDVKAYIIKAWYFKPGNDVIKFDVKILDESAKKEYKYEFRGIRDRSYIRLKPIFVLCPSNMKIYINNVLIPEEREKNPEEAVSPTASDIGGPMVRILQRSNDSFKEITEGMYATSSEEIFVQIIAGTFPTGGYRIELDDPDIVFPVSEKRGKITITGTFYRPGKGDMVTQAFTTPSKTISLGKLPEGDYDIYVNIKDLGEFLATLRVK
ncbi:MAG: protease complex subunit PrcB family protein [Fervidobacterium sp.]